MIDEKQLTLQQQQNKVGLETLADIYYVCDFTAKAMSFGIRRLQPSNLKNVALEFKSNQLNWVNKMDRAAKEYSQKFGVSVYSQLQTDVTSDEIEIYYAIISLLKQAKYMEEIATALEYMVKLGDKLPEVAPKLIMWLKNEIELNK